MTKNRPFNSIYSHGFVRAAVCVPKLRVADPRYNLTETLALARQASDNQSALALFPELGLPVYTAEDLPSLYSRVHSIIQSLMPARNFYIALYDSLTGLANRRGLSEQIEDEVSRFRRSARPFSFVLCDIDDFKQINDRHGHERGDEVLVRVAQVFRALLREQDHAARWGGEEFLLLLPETDEAGARIAAERLRQGIAAVGSAPDDPALPFHMTFGVSGYTDALGVEGSLKAADEALYRGKTQGKNRVVAASAG